MAKIDPLTYQKMTNIEEHNQMIDKTNEIVDTINALDIEGIPQLETDVTALKSDVAQLKISDAENVGDISQAQKDISAHATEISAIKVKDVQQDTSIKENADTIDALTKELPTEITLYRDGTGKIRAQVEKEDSTTFDSNTLDMIIPYQYDIISGTTNRSFKLKVTFSDGSSATTNDFVIPEGGGTDVTVTGITLSKDASNSNKFKASIVLSDSTTIDSGYLEMITAVSATFSNKKLTIKVNGVESVPITIDTGITYTGGNGITITGGTISIDSTVVALKSDIPDVSGFATKTELNAVDAKVNAKADTSTVQQIQTAVGDCFNDVSIDGNVITFTATDGQSNSITLPTQVRTAVDLSTVSDTITPEYEEGGRVQIRYWTKTTTREIMCKNNDVKVNVDNSSIVYAKSVQPFCCSNTAPANILAKMGELSDGNYSCDLYGGADASVYGMHVTVSNGKAVLSSPLYVSSQYAITYKVINFAQIKQ